MLQPDEVSNLDQTMHLPSVSCMKTCRSLRRRVASAACWKRGDQDAAGVVIGYVRSGFSERLHPVGRSLTISFAYLDDLLRLSSSLKSAATTPVVLADDDPKSMQPDRNLFDIIRFTRTSRSSAIMHARPLCSFHELLRQVATHSLSTDMFTCLSITPNTRRFNMALMRQSCPPTNTTASPPPPCNFPSGHLRTIH